MTNRPFTLMSKLELPLHRFLWGNHVIQIQIETRITQDNRWYHRVSLIINGSHFWGHTTPDFEFPHD